jgi:hypothetical protein
MAMSGMLLWLAIAFSGGGANDLLDYLPSGAYWKAKGVKPSLETMLAELKRPGNHVPKDLPRLLKDLGADEFAVREAASARIRGLGPAVIPRLKAESGRSSDAEVRTRIAQLVKELSGAAKAGEVRLLMAIRALGEFKKREALGELRAVAKSREPFVADYARAAIAAIEGKKYSRPVPSARELAGDPWLLPNYVGAVAQMSMPPGGKKSLEESLKEMSKNPALREALGDPERVKAQLARVVTEIAERIGNVRIQAVTVGLSEEVGNRIGFAIAVARVQYDPSAVKAALLGKGGRCESVDGVDVVKVSGPKPGVRLILPSSKRLVFIIGADEAAVAQPVKDMLAALKAGKGKLCENAPLSALVKAVKPVDRPWAVACVSKCYRQAPLLAGFETMSLKGKRNGNATELTLVARGRDDEKLRAAAAMMKGFQAQAVEGLKREATRMVFLKPLADFAQSLKFVTEPGKLSVRGRLEGHASPMLMVLPWMMMVRGGSRPMEVPVPDAAAVPAIKRVEVVPVPAGR